jgi:hypothetical protein
MIDKKQVSRLLDDLKHIGALAGEFSKVSECLKSGCGKDQVIGCIDSKVFLLESACHTLGRDLQKMIEDKDDVS